jgi:hypothetical protein
MTVKVYSGVCRVDVYILGRCYLAGAGKMRQSLKKLCGGGGGKNASKAFLTNQNDIILAM